MLAIAVVCVKLNYTITSNTLLIDAGGWAGYTSLHKLLGG